MPNLTRPSEYPKPELLAPAGNRECVQAAVANGADAVYIGLEVLNARLRADNFQLSGVAELADWLHERNVRLHVTMNTLVFTNELVEAVRTLAALEAANVDAVIVQDLGLASLAREVAPELAVHGSTQMTITSPEGAEFAARLGLSRMILARELSLAEIERVANVRAAPIEVFVHGALCVAYSGQCLTSEAFGQRSANRGECAQACRMPYELVVDGETVDLAGRRYLLSPQDLAAIREIPDLVRLGVASFKIEGRLKSPEYVAAVTSAYRRAIDAVTDDDPIRSAPPSPPPGDEDYRLEMAFSRGLYSGWMHGVNHQELVHARFGKKRGPLVGHVARCGTEGPRNRAHTQVDTRSGEWSWIDLMADPGCPLTAGDGVAIDTGGNPDDEQGGRIYAVNGRRLSFGSGSIRIDEVAPGSRIWKTSDPQLDRTLRRSFAQEIPPTPAPLTLRVSGRLGERLELIARSTDGREARAQSESELTAAKDRPLGREILARQLGRLGGTRYTIGELTLDLDGALMLPVRELNHLRREVVTQLETSSEKQSSKEPADARDAGNAITAGEVLAARLNAIASRAAPTAGDTSTLSVLCRSLEHIEAAIALGVTEIYCDFEDIRRYADAVSFVRSHPDVAVFLATPRIQKAGEHGFFHAIEHAAPDGILVRNLGAIAHFAGGPLRLVGDFSLNVANPFSAALLLDEGFERLTVSYDLNSDQVIDLLRSTPAGWFELTLHQHIPMFHMEHCVYAAFLSEGTDHTNCGRPCDHHDVKMRDHLGVEHPLSADVGCRNTLYHAQAQSGAEYWDAFHAAGARAVRVELLRENRAAAEDVIVSYQRLLAGETTARKLVAGLSAKSQLGVTRGPLEVK